VVCAAAGLLWAVGIMGLGVWGLGALVGWSNDRTHLARDTAEAARRADHRPVAYHEVGGECAEDHARTGAWYAARLTHGVKVSTGETSVSADVRRPDADVLRAALERWHDPYWSVRGSPPRMGTGYAAKFGFLLRHAAHRMPRQIRARRRRPCRAAPWHSSSP
jgi:hypothetical protein